MRGNMGGIGWDGMGWDGKGFRRSEGKEERIDSKGRRMLSQINLVLQCQRNLQSLSTVERQFPS